MGHRPAGGYTYVDVISDTGIPHSHDISMMECYLIPGIPTYNRPSLLLNPITGICLNIYESNMSPANWLNTYEL